jgi:hypothetical protein
MRFLYLDDSGKAHANDQALAVAFAGVSVDEDSYHDLVRRLTAAKAKYFPSKGNGDPHSWELKSADLLTPKNWKRRTNREFVREMVRILRRCDARVYGVTALKARAMKAVDESWLVPLMIQRMATKFYAEVQQRQTTGMIVCDWSTYKLDDHIARCVGSMVATRRMREMRGGVTYGSSHAVPPLQAADIIVSTFRRSREGQAHLSRIHADLQQLRYSHPTERDIDNHPVDSIVSLF